MSPQINHFNVNLITKVALTFYKDGRFFYVWSNERFLHNCHHKSHIDVSTRKKAKDIWFHVKNRFCLELWIIFSLDKVQNWSSNEKTFDLTWNSDFAWIIEWSLAWTKPKLIIHCNISHCHINVDIVINLFLREFGKLKQ